MSKPTTVINPSIDCRICHTANVDYTLVTEWNDAISGKRWAFHSPVCGDHYCVEMLEDRLFDRVRNMQGNVVIEFTLVSIHTYNQNDDPFGG